MPSIIAVTGLAAHAYGSWAHSSHDMWLRDYLPKDVVNARVLIYGYPSQLQGSASSGILADHSSNFIYRLLSMRESTGVSTLLSDLTVTKTESTLVSGSAYSLHRTQFGLSDHQEGIIPGIDCL